MKEDSRIKQNPREKVFNSVELHRSSLSTIESTCVLSFTYSFHSYKAIFNYSD